MGNLEEATRHAEAMLAVAERTRTVIWQSRSMGANLTVSSAKGDWQNARDFAEKGLEGSPVESPLLGTIAIVEYQVGDSDAGVTYLGRLIDTHGETRRGRHHHQ